MHQKIGLVLRPPLKPEQLLLGTQQNPWNSCKKMLLKIEYGTLWKATKKTSINAPGF